MKKRTFLMILVLFLLFFHISIFMISVITWKDKLNTQKERGLAEHFVFISSMVKDMQAVESRQGNMKQSMEEIIQPYMQYSQNNAVELLLYQDNYQLAGSPNVNWEMYKGDISSLSDSFRTVKIEGKEPSYLYIAGRFPKPYQQYVLVCRYSIEETISSWRQMKNTLYFFGGFLGILFAGSLLWMLEQLFKPLHQISIASQKIADGNYENRLVVSGNDEIAHMAKSFNHMAAEIENKIEVLREAAEQKQQFIDNFAHELRTPLTAIYGFAEYIQKAVTTEDDKIFASGYIMSECSRMQKMAYQLLDLAMLRGSEIDHNERIQVSELLDSTANTIRIKTAEKGIQVNYQNGLDYISGNRELLESLLINLLDNAIKASNRNGVIIVKAYCEKETRIIEVADFGKGMTQEQLMHIKEAFYRADKSRSRKEGGAGLGLSICEQIAVLHGAQLQFVSAEGKGTTVKIIFTT